MADKKNIVDARKQLSAVMADPEVTPETLMRQCFEYMHTMALETNPKTSPRGLKPYYGIKVLLSNGKTTRRNLYAQYDACKKAVAAITDERDAATVLQSTVAETLLAKSSKGYIGLPGTWDARTPETKPELPAI